MTFDYEEINALFNADRWLEDNYGMEFSKKGSFLNSCCPFDDHLDSNPSFGINMDKHYFHCFGCGRNGNFVIMISQLLDITNYQAALTIAEYENISLTTNDTFDLKNNRFKKASAISDLNDIETKNKRIVQKTTAYIKRVMRTDFVKADALFEKLDSYLEVEDYRKIKELSNG